MDPKTIERALAAVRKVLDGHRLGLEDIEILYRSSNLVIHFRPLSIVAKIVSLLDRSEAEKGLELQVAGHLRKEGVPCAAPSAVLPVQVYSQDGFLMTFWDYFEGRGVEVPDRGKSAELIGRLQEGLASFPGAALPRFDARLDEYADKLGLGSVAWPGVAEEERLFLLRLLADLKTRLNGSSTQVGVIHGDCRPDNLLWNQEGAAAWIDFEAVCIGPVAWDYLTFFDAKEEILRPHAATAEILADMAKAFTVIRIWRKTGQRPALQKAAEDHLRQLRQKYRFT